MRSLKKDAKIGGLILVAAIVAAQFFRIEKTNPPMQAEIQAPAAVKPLLRRACYDCHSNETMWPWYSNISPVSWLIASDVNEGRKELNFSEWGTYDSAKQKRKLEEIGEEVQAEKMPLWIYTLLHDDANLSREERNLIRSWSESEGTLPEPVPENGMP